MRKKIVSICSVIALSFCVLLSACSRSEKVIIADKKITVTLLNGENYYVEGDNKQEVIKGAGASFNVKLDRGYEVVAAYGDEYLITSNQSFEQTVTFTDVRYKATLRLETKEIETTDFVVNCKSEIEGSVEINSILGQASENSYYINDTISLTAIPASGYRFWCWSTDKYMTDGGNIYSYGVDIEDYNFLTTNNLYANFKSLTDTKDTIIYRFENGFEIEQDCTAMLEHHPRANTLTAVDLRDRGVDCESKMLIGWQTQEGEYVGLGSRVAVSATTTTILFPLWKDYTDEKKFVTDGNKITAYSGEAEEIVIPRSINGQEIAEISQEAFSGSVASVYYLPDTITKVDVNAFKDCEALTELYMSDNVMNISDSSFAGCKNFTTLHLNAYLKPRFMHDNYTIKQEVYERLKINSEADNRKLILLGGSSVKHGYSSKVICQKMENIDVYNIGNNFTINAYAQYELFQKYIKEGDIVLHAPEHMNEAWSGEVSDSVITENKEMSLSSKSTGWYIFCMLESNLQFVSELTVNKYCDFFYWLNNFNELRIKKEEMKYTDYYKTVDSGFGVYANGEFIYGECGIYNNNHSNPYIDFNEVNDYAVKLANTLIYEELSNRNIFVYTTFAPTNRHNVIVRYCSEENLRSEAAAYTNRVLNDITYSTVILTQYDTVYDGEHFSDSDYHLGHPFRDVHTEKVITALIESLKEQGKL